MGTEVTSVVLGDRNGVITLAYWLVGSLGVLLLTGCGVEGPRQPSLTSSHATSPRIDLTVPADGPPQTPGSGQPETGADDEESASSRPFFTDALISSSELEKMKAARDLTPEHAPTISMTSTSNGAAVRVTWEVAAEPLDSETRVLGYYVYYGKQPADQMGGCFYEGRIAVDAPPVTINDLEPNVPYFFAISAYNEYESSCSRETTAIAPPAQ